MEIVFSWASSSVGILFCLDLLCPASARFSPLRPAIRCLAPKRSRYVQFSASKDRSKRVGAQRCGRAGRGGVGKDLIPTDRTVEMTAAHLAFQRTLDDCPQ